MIYLNFLAASYKIPDSRYKVMTLPGNYTFQIDATDLFTTLSRTYVLEVQDPITSLIANVNPSTPQMNIDACNFLKLII